VGEVRGSNPADSPYHFTYNHINQSLSDTWRQWIGPRVLTLLATNDTCHLPIRQPSTNECMPCHHRTVCTALPRQTVRTVRTGTVSIKIFACLAWRTDRDIFSIRRPFDKVNIPPESGRRDRRNGTVFVTFRAL
jgi:hypothetical protein